MNLRHTIGKRFEEALRATGIEDAEPLVAPATRPEFGDYQVNGIMPIAKRTKQNPRQLAEAVLAAVKIDDIAYSVTIAGPGFINLTIAPAFARAELGSVNIDATIPTERVVVDYSSPNLAKEMHVGHLRTTIIGDAFVRALEALGNTVIRQNHIGDWGNQFGRLVAHLEDLQEATEDLADLEAFYIQASQRYETDPPFAERARETVVALQSGDETVTARWRRFIDISLSHCQTVYDRLGVTLSPADIHGESAYKDDLAAIVTDLDEQGLLTESDGAQCVFLDEFKAKDGSPLPVIVQKSDGAYLYASTDLAAIRHRCAALAADRVVYFVDARQTLHFRQVFAVAREAGFAANGCHLEHQPFGMMTGKDGKPFRTREGGVVKLTQLLDEACARAANVVRDKSPELTEEEVLAIARVVGIGAIKYADLSKNRISDYVFDWDAMLSFDGNTAPYLQYAYARIQSLFRRGKVDPVGLIGVPDIIEPAERQLAVTLLRLQETVEQVANDALPHHLCAYLYDVASQFMRFYEACPVLDAPAETRQSRLILCQRTAQTLALGLGLLGIDTVERM